MSDEIALAIRDNQIANLKRKLNELETENIVLICRITELENMLAQRTEPQSAAE